MSWRQYYLFVVMVGVQIAQCRHSKDLDSPRKVLFLYTWIPRGRGPVSGGVVFEGAPYRFLGFRVEGLRFGLRWCEPHSIQ